MEPEPEMMAHAQSASESDWEYVTSHPRLGDCLIINNEEFERHTEMKSRAGSSVDAKKLSMTFADLGFNVKLLTNLSALAMRQTIAQVIKKDHSDADCFACVILSHGDAGIVYATDDYVTVRELVTPFSEERCKSLAGKPKLFFIQACRGDDLDEGVEVTDADPEDDDTTYRSPNVADVIIHYSTVYGYYSWRNPHKGSWFVQALCDVINKEIRDMKDKTDAGKCDVMSRDLTAILTRVNHVVSRNFQSRHTSNLFDSKKQMPCIFSMLRKQFYFRHKITVNNSVVGCAEKKGGSPGPQV